MQESLQNIKAEIQFLESDRYKSKENYSESLHYGGRGEVRTPDIRLVRATLSQLSYTPIMLEMADIFILIRFSTLTLLVHFF